MYIHSGFRANILTCDADAYPEGIHEERRELPNRHGLTGHQQTSLIQYTQDDDISTQPCLQNKSGQMMNLNGLTELLHPLKDSSAITLMRIHLTTP